MKLTRWFVALVAVLLLCPVTARASDAPDPSRKGSITVEMVYEKKEVKGGALSAWYVGSIQGNRFVKTPEMAAFPGSYDDVTDPRLAGEIAAYVKERKLPAVAEVENKDGKVKFSGLELGLYLIEQTKSSEGFDPISPFLVTVPMNEDGRYVYDVNASAKFQLHQESKPTQPTNPTKPTDPTQPAKPTQPTAPKLPQTGQLNWPVPVMVAVGLLLFSAGWILRFGKKKETNHEE